jgi:O-antigen ligase
VAFGQSALGMLAYAELAVRLGLFAGCLLAAYVLGRHLLAAGLREPAIDSLSCGLLAGALASVAIQWLQLLGSEVLPGWLAVVSIDAAQRQRPFANLAQSNHLATYLAWACISTLYLHARLHARRPGFGAALLLVTSLALLAAGLALTGSRMGALFVALLLAATFAPTALRPADLRSRAGATAALLLGYGAALFTVRLTSGPVDTMARFAQDTLPIRFELWKQAAQLALRHPWIGVGTGQFGGGQYEVAESGRYTVPANDCHNLLLQLACEFGGFVACAVGLAAAWWAASGLRARLARPQDALAWSLLAAVAIHSLLEYPLWHLYFAIPACLLLGLGEPPLARSWTLDARRMLGAAGVAMLLVALALRVDYDAVTQAATPDWLEAMHLRHKTAEDALAVLVVADSPRFQPEVDRLLLDLRHPPDEQQGGPLRRSARQLRLLPAPEVIAQYVVQLARAGRIEEAIHHASRLRVFAGNNDAGYREWILDQTRDLGPQTAPLRRALREWR